MGGAGGGVRLCAWDRRGEEIEGREREEENKGF